MKVKYKRDITRVSIKEMEWIKIQEHEINRNDLWREVYMSAFKKLNKEEIRNSGIAINAADQSVHLYDDRFKPIKKDKDS